MKSILLFKMENWDVSEARIYSGKPEQILSLDLVSAVLPPIGIKVLFGK